MKKITVAEASSTLFSLLEQFSPEEQARIVRGTMILLGSDAVQPALNPNSSATNTVPQQKPAATKNASDFFDIKEPQRKGEELAVAVCFLEEKGTPPPHNKEQIQSVVVSARRNFDARNFARDMDNAMKAHFFNKGGTAGSGFTLSHYGQKYVDMLPAREKLSELKRPKASASGKKRVKQ